MFSALLQCSEKVQWKRAVLKFSGIAAIICTLRRLSSLPYAGLSFTDFIQSEELKKTRKQRTTINLSKFRHSGILIEIFIIVCVIPIPRLPNKL